MLEGYCAENPLASENISVVAEACNDLLSNHPIPLGEEVVAKNRFARALTLTAAKVPEIACWYLPFIATFCDIARIEPPDLSLLPYWPTSSTVCKMEYATRNVKSCGKDRFKKGMIHGHFRLFTPSNIIPIIFAGTHCELTLLLESGERTQTYKRKGIFMSDTNRLEIARVSGLATRIAIIKGVGNYTNNSYAQLAQQFAVYFPPQEIDSAEADNRLGSAVWLDTHGAFDPIYVLGPSTSDFERLMYPRMCYQPMFSELIDY